MVMQKLMIPAGRLVCVCCTVSTHAAHTLMYCIIFQLKPGILSTGRFDQLGCAVPCITGKLVLAASDADGQEECDLTVQHCTV